MRKSVLHALAAMAWLGIPAFAAADEVSPVSCDGFALGYDAPALQKTCEYGETSRGQTSWKTSRLQQRGDTYRLEVTYLQSGFRTYMVGHSVTEELGQLAASGFQHVVTIGDARNMRGFEAIAFNADEANARMTCGLFVRFSGNPGNYEFPGGPGSKNRTWGLYCSRQEYLSQPERGEGFYGLLEQVIAKLHVPAE